MKTTRKFTEKGIILYIDRGGMGGGEAIDYDPVTTREEFR